MNNNVSGLGNSLFSRNGIIFILFCLCFYFQAGHGGIYILTALLFSVLVFSSKYRVFDNNSILIILFSATFNFLPLIVGQKVNFAFALYFTVCPVAFYMYGKGIMNIITKGEQLLDIYIVIIICFCSFIFINLFLYNNFIYNPIAEERVLYMGNSEEDAISATGIGTFITLCFIGIPIFFYFKTKLKRRIFLLAISILALYTTTFLLNRSGLFSAIMSFLVVSLYCSRKNFIRAVLVVLVIFVLYTLSMHLGWINQDVVDAYAMRNEDLSTGANRFERWGHAMDNLLVYPFGWAKYEHAYVHNMWLDVARSAGLLPLILIIVITYKIVKDLWWVCKKKTNNITVLFLALFICFIASMLVEPTLQSVPGLFLIFLFLAGNMNEYRQLMKSNTSIE